MQLRLLLTEMCNRKCKGCCNKDHDLSVLPVCRDFRGYESIMITGGEPLLDHVLLGDTIRKIRTQTDAPIFIYTAFREDPILLISVLDCIEGITLTLHTRKDVAHFRLFNDLINFYEFGKTKSLRLNVFRGISLAGIDLSAWKVKSNMVWLKDCPVPENEVFMRLTD